MSLYFEERICEQIIDPLNDKIPTNEQEEDDPENDKITFIFPWIFTLPPWNENNEDRQYISEKEIITSYHVCGFKWHLKLEHDAFIAHTSMGDGWLKTCNVSYNLYSDNDMRHELYSSPKISARFDLHDEEYRTPDGFLTKFNNAYQKREIAKMVIFVELILHAKTFLCPFDLRLNFLYGDVCMEYPEDIENDFRFEFMKDG
uniref:MATH domain-containing protein n=1 Tax=Panagrolaimus davidi TaxID=227884 RepID=A0A914QB25_9BILA